METAEEKKQAVTLDYLRTLVYKYAANNYGEYPKYISINERDVYKLKEEIYIMGYIIPAGKTLKFMGIRLLECINLEPGEVILSK